ncbi:MAG: GGDEF domain-containing protein, partial [Spirochaetaceae bacterium]|nr:GGDEF domain-containing protein [Spirochaetaceae bacterium]
FSHIDNLNQEIRNYKSLLSGAMDIFNRTTIDDIMDATVWQISDQFLPSFIAFIWKPLQNKDDITIRGYKNYKMIDLSIKIENLTPFEDFFHRFPKPISYDLLVYQLNNPAATEPMDGIHPELVVPILGHSGLYGLIIIGHKILEDEYTIPELALIEHLMSFVSQAIQNNLHYEHSVRDIKTGLFNHGFFMTRLNEEVARSSRTDSPSSLIVMDVDKFKHFNDNYGHMAGDRVLESIALMIKQNVRTEDVPSRFGGEEFTILLPDTGKSAAWVVAERIRTEIAAMKVPWDPPLPQVTISIGVFIFDKRTNLSSEDIIHRADAALYQSKRRGRNRTTVWGTGLLFRIQQGNQAAS